MTCRLSLVSDRVVKAVLSPVAPDVYNAYHGAARQCGFSYNAFPEACHYGNPLNVRMFVAALKVLGISCTLDTAMQAYLSQAHTTSAKAVTGLKERLKEFAGRGLTLLPFQVEGASWLTTRKRALLADEQRVGKLVQVQAALPDNAAVLVVCPKTVRSTWERETKVWRPDLAPIQMPPRQFRWPKPGEVLITHPHALPRWDRPLPPLSWPVYCVLDECHFYRNPRTLTTKAAMCVTRMIRHYTGTTWGTTGTPNAHAPAELWTLLQVLGLEADAYGHFGRFKKAFNAYESPFGLEWGTPTQAAYTGLKKVALWRFRKDVMPQLPEKFWEEIPVDINADTRRKLDAIMQDLVAKGVDIEKAFSAVEHTMENPLPSINEISRYREILSVAKLPFLVEMIEEAEAVDEPLIVFSSHRAPAEFLVQRPGWAVITGDTSVKARGRICEEFQSGALKGICATIRSAGEGITLTRSNHVIFVDRDWVPAMNRQAEDRPIGLSQKRGVLISTLVANHSVDRQLYKVLMVKQNREQAVLR